MKKNNSKTISLLSLLFFFSIFPSFSFNFHSCSTDSVIHEAVSVDNKKMETKENNFTSFSVFKKEHIAEWEKYNKPENYSHPDFGITQSDVPCPTCVEVLDKRTIDSKYFINYENPSEFFIQKGVGEFFHKVSNQWVSIDDKLKPLSNGLYQSNYYLEPVGIDVNSSRSYILTKTGKVFFNNWSLLSETNGNEITLANADWTNYSIGEDGIYIKNIFKGIDAQMIVYRGAVKTNFVMKSNEFGVYTNLIFRDTFSSEQNTCVKFLEDSTKLSGEGALLVYSGNDALVQMKEAVIYPKDGLKEQGQLAAYKLSRNKVDIVVPFSWISNYINSHELIIDPLVTGTNTLAQASILGSMYNASCTFTNSCNYNLTVAAPANATFTNVLWSFNYVANGICWLSDGGTRFSRGACVSPATAGFYWYCNSVGNGTCTGSNISIFSDLAPCLPAPSCVPQNVLFTLQFYRKCWGVAGCSGTCIGAATPWTMTIQGHTIEYANVVTPISISASTICQGQSVTVSTSGTYGVPGYTYNWSLSPSGIPTVGSSSSASINFPSFGSYTIYCFVTDACGNTITSSVPLTVNQNVTVNANIDQAVCVGGSISLAGSISGGAVTGTWSASSGTFSPNATVLNATYTPSIANGTVTLTLTSVDPAGPCPAVIDQLVVTVTPQTVPTFGAIGPFCQNSVAPALPTSSTNFPAITGTWAPAVSTATAGTTVYTFTPTAGQCATTTTLSITVDPQITPTFNAIANVCQFSVAPVLPTSSTNIPAITGTWSPAVSTATAGTTVYTFTPTAGQCATTTTLSITVDPQITPTFNAIANVCQFSVAPVLPTSSTNIPAITGTWTPAVSTATAGTTVYTFTPTAGQCATTTTLSITVDPQITPTFNAVANVCQFSVAPVLPTSSTNIPAITGTWSPAVSTATAGTTVYTFTPTAGQCATTTTLSITVDPQITPTFNAIANVCQFSVAPVLPTSSTNIPAITGTWSPAVSTATAGTTVYTFTPTAGQCASITTLSVTVDPQITPAFTQIGQLCQNSVPPLLPASSNDIPAITGTWNTLVSTTVPGNTVYTFTPTIGQCATSTTMTINVTNQIVPTFAAIPNICQGGVAPSLPLSSTNLPAITGTWLPAVINTAAAGTVAYTFTPAAGQCAIPTTINVTIDALITPTFTTIGPLCQNSASQLLPANSTNLPAITGSWNDTISTAILGNTTYTFTPSAGQCASSATMIVNITTQITPTFTAIPNVCQNAVAPVLPTSSTNIPSIIGVWNSTVNTANAGTNTYTFTPNAGQCAIPTTISVTIDPLITPTFAPIGPLCQNSAPPVMPVNSTNIPVITGTWSPAISTATAGTTVYTFTPTAGQCATTATMSIVVNATPTSAINYSSPSYCVSNTAVQNVVQTGTPGGTYSASPAGLFINTTNGAVTPDLSTPGIYTVTYTIPASGSCPPLLTTTNITINALPVLNISADVVSGCVPLCVTFTDQSPGSSSLVTWGWNFGDGSPSQTNQNPPLHCFTTAGTYSVSFSATSAAGCASSLLVTDMINVIDMPVANFGAPMATSIENPVVSFTDSSHSATSWFWEFGDAQNPSSDTSHLQYPSHTYSLEGNYCVTLITGNEGMCFDTAEVCLQIAGVYTLYIPNAFTPNDDGTNDFFFCKGTNIKEFEMRVFDRWGVQVFYSDDITKAWDGRVNGSIEATIQDVYVYKVTFKDNVDLMHDILGEVTVVK